MAEQKPPPKAEAPKKMPWWGKMILGIAGVYLISTKTPILEILNLFFYVVMIPIGLAISIGLITQGGFQAFQQNWVNMMNDVKGKIETRAKEMVDDVAPTATPKSRKKAA